MSEWSSYKILSFPAKELPDQYKGLVYAKFLRSVKWDNEFFKLIDQDAYFNAYHLYLGSLLNRHNSVVKIAVLVDDPDVALGWALIEPHKVHYCWVNPGNRQIGVASSLLAEPFDTFTHLSNTGLMLWQSKFAHAKFNPFA